MQSQMSMPVVAQRIPTFQKIRVGDIIAFHYNGENRRMRVESVDFGKDYVRGENLMVDGQCPNRQYSTYNFSKMLSNNVGHPALKIED